MCCFNNYLDVWDKPVIAVCNTSPTLVAAFELLVSLCAGCIENLQYVTNILTELYYPGMLLGRSLEIILLLHMK